MRKIKTYMWGILFAICVYVLGMASAARLVVFHMNDEISNNEWTNEMGSKFETDYITNFWGKNTFINIHGGIRRVLGQKEMNGVTKLKNGYLVTLMEDIENEKIGREIEQASGVQKQLGESGIEFLYVMSPYTVCKYDAQLSEEIPDYGNEIADNVLKEMSSRNIDYLDIRQKIQESGSNHYDMMYRTDHHWNEKGGFFAYQQIIEYIEMRLQVETNPIYKDVNNYDVLTYEKWHLGSNGQRTGKLYAGIDDFRIIVPRFETKFSRGESVTDFKETFICEDALKKTDYSSRYTYDTTFAALGHFKNEMSDNDIKVVMICDSMGKAVAPYLALSVAELHVLDAYSVTEMSLDDVKAYKPDIVIFLHSPGMYKYGGLFSFS